ncbi:MAG: tRNA (adenosine(37)-N6)-threonylcarbamoyltransferase complex dimerization subunit type 1 TsaB [Pseudomonadota bacterium]
MRPDPTILAFDTSAAHCAAALLMGGTIVARRYEEMKKGQAERLFPMLEEVLGDVSAVWKDLDAIGVGTGPGNFTGIRIAVSAARGLALGLDIPAVGISTFEIAQRMGQPRGDGLGWTEYLPAPQGRAYAQGFRDAQLTGAPWIVDGHESDTLSYMNTAWSGETLEHLATRTATKLAEAVRMSPPAPLYIRPPDAAPSSDPPPVILS